MSPPSSFRNLPAAKRRPPARHPGAGTGRVGGIVLAMLTAAVVFGGGMAILPPIEPTPPEPPVAPPAPVAQPADILQPAGPDDAATAGADNPDGAAAAAPTPAARAEVAAPAPVVDRPEAAQPRGREAAPAKERPPATEAAAESDRKPGDKATDKDVAREAWRKNLPDISSGEKGKAAILIPIKGSIEGASFHVTTKPRGVLVNLPKGESMITMRFYKLRREGFRQLWIKQEENEGTTLRVVLSDAIDPQVEIKDDFVRVTVRRVEAAPAEPAAEPAAAAPASPAPE